MKKPSVAVVAIAIVLMSACGSPNATTPTGSSAANVPAANAPKGNPTLIWDLQFGGLATIDPGVFTGIFPGNVLHAAYDTLVSYDGGDVSKVVPQLADSWDVSTDVKTYTFHLRKDAKFADASPVTSADVVFSYNRLKNLQSPGSIKMAGLAVSAPDPYTVVMTSDIPAPALPVSLTHLSFSVLNSAAARQQGADASANAKTLDKAQPYLDAHSLGSGPYTIESNEYPTRMVLKANPNYSGKDKPAFEQIIFRNTPSDAQLLTIQKGESNIVTDLSPTQADQISTKDVSITLNPSLRYFFLLMNQSKGTSTITTNRDFMDSVRYGIDYKGLVAVAGKGTAQPAGLVPAILPGHLEASEAPARDLAKAKAALAKSGLANPSVSLEYASDYTPGVSADSLAQKVQADLKEVGITVVLKPNPTVTATANWNAGKSEMAIWPTTLLPDASSAVDMFCPGKTQTGGATGVGRASWAKGADPEMDALCVQASSAPPAERVGVFQKWQRLMNQRGPIVPLVATTIVVASSSWVTNAPWSGAFTVNLRQVGR